MLQRGQRMRERKQHTGDDQGNTTCMIYLFVNKSYRLNVCLNNCLTQTITIMLDSKDTVNAENAK
jgi:hypothetical protein